MRAGAGPCASPMHTSPSRQALQRSPRAPIASVRHTPSAPSFDGPMQKSKQSGVPQQVPHAAWQSRTPLSGMHMAAPANPAAGCPAAPDCPPTCPAPAAPPRLEPATPLEPTPPTPPAATGAVSPRSAVTPPPQAVSIAPSKRLERGLTGASRRVARRFGRRRRLQGCVSRCRHTSPWESTVRDRSRRERCSEARSRR